MIVALTGAPGAGKGTQTDLLAQREGMRKLSTGDALRKHVRLGTEIGKVAGSIMDLGKLVPDDVLFQIVREELSTVDPAQVVLLDGYPRNIEQAKTLDSLSSTHPVRAVIQLNVPRAELISRLSGRRVCGSCGATYHVTENPPSDQGTCQKCGGLVSQRIDDRAEAVAVRLDVYTESTAPILDFYEQKGLVRQINGVGDLEAIYNEIKGVVRSL